MTKRTSIARLRHSLDGQPWHLVWWLLTLRLTKGPNWHREYQLNPHEDWALALAHPMAFNAARTGFANGTLPRPSPTLRKILLTPTKHLIGLRSDMSEALIAEALPARLIGNWYRMDLSALHADDDARDAMAFACARVAFVARIASMMGWLDQPTQWEILHLNAQRASDCFPGWNDFGKAFARGRRQWVAHSRADSLGVAFTEADVDRWTADRWHVWHNLPWPQPKPPKLALA